MAVIGHVLGTGMLESAMRLLERSWQIRIAVLTGAAFVLFGEASAATEIKISIVPGSCKTPYPPFPLSARRNKEVGTVVMRVSVSADGKLDNLAVAQSTGFEDLDTSARDWLASCRFSPASTNGVTHADRNNMKLQFNLRD
jgi:protein TonB